MALHVGSFGGGVVLAGSADQHKVDELLEADSFVFGLRGALITAGDVVDYVTIFDAGLVPGPVSKLHAILSAMPGFSSPKLLAFTEGAATLAGPFYLISTFDRSGDASPIVSPIPISAHASAVEGVIVTGFSWPGAWTIPNGMATEQVNIALFCLGAREGFAPKSNLAFGLYVAVQVVGTPGFVAFPIGSFSALGTGPNGDGVPLSGGGLDTGSDSQQLFARGVVGYNNHAFIWGFDSNDSANGDGPARVMFCNLGNPLKWGNDNQGNAGANRHFTDSDAIPLGASGEIIRGAIAIFGRLFFGTNKGLHFIGGYGRDSFLTDGSTPVMNAYNVVGPHAMIEGPDKLLYGVGDDGLWSFDGQGIPVALFLRLQDQSGASPGFFDLMWNDDTSPLGPYPGVTNRDLVWMANDWDCHNLLLGIPFCDATAGSGPGPDTVVIKYNVMTGGFTRQVFGGVAYTAAGFFRSEGGQGPAEFFGTATSGQVTVKNFHDLDPNSVSPPSSLPAVTFGPYAPYGPDGRGSMKRLYLTLSWKSIASLPIVLAVSFFVDQALSDAFLLTISGVAPIGPSINDLWLDTSLSDANLGNGTAGVFTTAFPAFLLKQWTGNAWRQLTGVSTNGLRATVRLPIKSQHGTRITVRVRCVSAADRFQLEGLGEKPSSGVAEE